MTRLNREFQETGQPSLQAHRVAKKMNNNMAFLDAVSEEINNSIFRLGHSKLGFSAALIGSGMAFEFDLLKEELLKINAVGGFDRALELTMFKLNKKIGYIDDLLVLDEKIQSYDDFSNQRRRWTSAHIHYFMEFVTVLPSQLLKGNKDFVDTLFQQISLQIGRAHV